MNNDLMLTIYSSPYTVFSVDEIAQMCPGVSHESILDRLYYFTRVGKLLHVHHGLYAKSKYNPLELANKLYKPSYVSFETVLAKAGVIFQYYETIHMASYVTRFVEISGNKIQYRRLKKGVLTNMAGIVEKDGYFEATKERAFLDAIYVYKRYHFDNLGALDFEIINEIKMIYDSKALENRVDEYYKLHREEYAKS